MDDYFDYYPELETPPAPGGEGVGAGGGAPGRRPGQHLLWCARRRRRAWATPSAGPAASWGDEPFAVLLGDDIMRAKKPVTLQLVEAAEKYGASAVGVQQVATEAISRYSSVKVSPLEERIFEVSDMNEKPTPEQRFSNYAILGRYVLTPEIFDILENVHPGYGGGNPAHRRPARAVPEPPHGGRGTLRAAATTPATCAASWRPPSTSPWIIRPPGRG